MRRRRETIGRFLLVGLAALAPAGCRDDRPVVRPDEGHYCLDAAKWAEWDKLLAKYPGDEDIISLYALRSGLCGMVLKGQVDTQTAIHLFDRAHQIVIGKTIEQNAAKRRQEEM